MPVVLVPYLVAATMILLAAAGRTVQQRSALALFAWLAMGVVVWSVIFRAVDGDTWRYYMDFLATSRLGFRDVIERSEVNVAFGALLWLLSRVGTDPVVMTAGTALLGTAALYLGLRLIFPAYRRAIMIFVYSMYPYFVFYIASGLKQAISMGLLFISFGLAHRRSRWFVLPLAAAPLFHSAALLAVAFFALHLVLFGGIMSRRKGLTLILGLHGVAIALSITGVNEALMSPIQGMIELSDRYAIYFMEAEELNYRAGFRPDFTLFTLFPGMVALLLLGLRHRPSLDGALWWLSLYFSLATIYQLFAFAPFADRFASYSWYILPVVVGSLVFETGRPRLVSTAILASTVGNVLLYFFYVGRVLQ